MGSRNQEEVRLISTFIPLDSNCLMLILSSLSQRGGFLGRKEEDSNTCDCSCFASLGVYIFLSLTLLTTVPWLPHCAPCFPSKIRDLCGAACLRYDVLKAVKTILDKSNRNDKDLAAKYTENWKNHAGHSEVYTGRQRR
jgi:hypothetical protein